MNIRMKRYLFEPKKLIFQISMQRYVATYTANYQCSLHGYIVYCLKKNNEKINHSAPLYHYAFSHCSSVRPFSHPIYQYLNMYNPHLLYNSYECEDEMKIRMPFFVRLVGEVISHSVANLGRFF